MLLTAQHPKEDVMKSKRASNQQQPEPPAALLILRNPEDLRREMQEVQLAIARRAYELFETRGCEHGHDWKDWLRAESELLRPVSVSCRNPQTGLVFALTSLTLMR